jgi:hypothetical protein
MDKKFIRINYFLNMLQAFGGNKSKTSTVCLQFCGYRI